MDGRWTQRDGEKKEVERRGRVHTTNHYICVYRNVTGKPTNFVDLIGTKYNFKRKEKQGYI